MDNGEVADFLRFSDYETEIFKVFIEYGKFRKPITVPAENGRMVEFRLRRDRIWIQMLTYPVHAAEQLKFRNRP